MAALFDLMSDKSDKWITNNKAVWAIIIIMMPFLGPVLYLLTSRLRFLFKR
ncbi:PLDc N-terminal domain-containing protein [Pedobacter immunditicola]|uniref:PLDc N-terminal domain-containing protein n=1 Tax=Pedobacter immunditicola TaxID=3133440 RepID=UPI003D71E19C